MKVKLVLVDSDKQYVDRFLNSIVPDYEDKIEVLAYTSPEQLKADKYARGDVYLISSEYIFDKSDFPAGCGIAYFTESKEIASYHGENAIAKYQRLNDIYTEILNLYAESSGIVIKDDTKNNGQVKMYIVTSGMGGTGKTTISVGIAQYLAMQGKKVLYVSLEALGNTEIYFVRGTQGDLGDIIYMLKSKRNNISIKLENIIQKDFMGVYYISSSENPYDLESLTIDDIKALIYEIKALKYDCLVVDMDSGIEEKYMELLLKAEKIVYVDADSKAAICKKQNFIKTMHMYEHKYSESIMNRVVGIMNKVERGKLPEGEKEIKYVGSIRLIRGTDRQLVQSISKSDAVAGVYV